MKTGVVISFRKFFCVNLLGKTKKQHYRNLYIKNIADNKTLGSLETFFQQ